MSPRPKNIRKVREIPAGSGFIPSGKCRKSSEGITLYAEEYEAILLCDYEDKTQAEAAEGMGISRPTLTRIYASARKKIAQAIIDRLPLTVEGGASYMEAQWFQCERCGMLVNNIIPGLRPDNITCPGCNGRCNGIDSDNINQNNYTLNSATLL